MISLQPSAAHAWLGELIPIWSSPESDDTISVAWGDWDGDGDLDLAIGNWGSQNRVYSNNGDSFDLVWSSSESEFTYSIAWGDWDGDGDPDLAVGNSGSQNRVYNNSGGNLVLAWSSPESDDSRSIAWGDWDEDGDLDLVVGNYDGQNRIYNNSGGNLVLAWSSPESDDTRSVAWEDWDGDGDLDLAVGNSGQNRVYSNSGGSLGLAWTSPESDDTRSVAWGDWDGDGDLDLAVSNYGGQNRIYNNGGGSFGLVWSSPESDDTTSVAWGDWDGDGDLDLVVGNYGGQNRVYSNSGDSFGLAWTSPESDDTYSVSWGDWDGDGDLDLAVGNSGSQNRVYSNSGGSLGLAWTSPESDDTYSVAWGDWDGDGDLDLAVGNYGQNRVYNNSGGNLVLAWTSPESDDTTSMAWGDWDGDGDLDLAVGNYGGQNQVYSNSGGSFGLAWTSPESDDTRSVAWGDWDKDGDLDLVVGNWNGQNRVYSNSGDSFGLAWTSPESDNTYSVSWGDWDGDGDLDLAVGNSYSQNRVYNNSGGSFSLVWSSPESDDTYSVAWGDWDGDGDLDLAIGNSYSQNRVYNNSGGSFSLVWSSPESNNTRTVAWGDWDGDGDLDLAVGNWGGRNQVYSASGGNLGLAWSSPESDDTYSVAWGDWDGDGDLDLVVGNDGDQNRVYNNSGGSLGLAWSSTESDDTHSVAWGDWDGDGDLDLAVGNDGGQNRIYNNSGGSFRLVWSSPESDDTSSVAWGDWDGDGDLDLAVGNGGYSNQQNRVYSNSGGNLILAWTSLESDGTHSVAWGDWDGDGDLDLAVGNDGGQNRVYNNSGGSLGLAWSSTESDDTHSVAWGDWDGDGDLDLAVGNDGQNRVYSNSGGRLGLAWSSSESDDTRSVAWGDWDGDGDLDLAAGNDGQNRVYRASGDSLGLAWTSPESDDTYSVAWGDWDGDGALNLAVGNFGKNRVYGGGSLGLAWTSTESDYTRSMAWGDWDGDGDLDLTVGNSSSTRIYSNHSADQVGLGNTSVTARITYPAGAGSSPMGTALVLDGSVIPITYTLHDPEQDTIVFVEAFYSLDGGSSWQPAVATGNTITQNLSSTSLSPLFFEGFEQSGHSTYMTATTPLTITGVPEAIFSSSDDGGRLRTQAGAGFYRTGSHAATLDRNPDGVNTINYLDFTLDLSAYDVANDNIVLDFSFMHHGEEVNPNDRVWVRGASGDSWVELVNLNNKQGAVGGYVDLTGISISHALQQAGQIFSATFQLRFGQEDNFPATSIIESDGYTFDDIRLRIAPIVHTYYWDVYASGVFGASDNAVFRLDVYQGSSGTSPIMYAIKSAITAPFRIRGSQARVVDNSGQPLSNAIVYRQPTGQATTFAPYYDLFNQPFHTNLAGYLQGFGEIGIGDQLIALAPITTTDTYTLYYGSAPVTETGLDAFEITAPGVQTLTVSADNTLILFDLDVSLEWDARNDAVFLEQLESDIHRASQLLYDVTNGQVALGDLTIHHNGSNWEESDIVIHATNSLRPYADIGGIVDTPRDDTLEENNEIIEDVYVPGQVHMSAIWNRFGDASGNLGEDWPRALAHELAHYLLFQTDNYLGISPEGLVIQTDCVGSFMTDPYRDDYSEFLTDSEWQGDCLNTVAENTTGRTDWKTATTFYPQLDGSGNNVGPSNLPLAVTQIDYAEEATPPDTLSAPIFNLTNAQTGSPLPPSPQARGYLFQTQGTPDLTDDRLLPLGTPNGDLLKARGTSPGDRLCLFDQTTTSTRLGCIENMTLNSVNLPLTEVPNWQPELTIQPVTSTTLVITATQTGVSGDLYVQLFPTASSPTSNAPVFQLQPTGISNTYAQTIHLSDPLLEGYARIWVANANPIKESIIDFALSDGWGPRGRRGVRFAPVASPDGQLLIFNKDFLLGETQETTVQSLTAPPNLDSWLTPIGQAYRFSAAEALTGTYSVMFNYLQRDVPDSNYENRLQIYHLTEGKVEWQALPTTLDTRLNLASALISNPGVYVLISTIEMAPFSVGWNNFGYPLAETRAVGDALASIAGDYSAIYHYGTNTSANWTLYDPVVTIEHPAFASLVNDLEYLQFGQAYWINATNPTTLFLGVSSSTANRPQSPTAIQQPPMTLYGQVTAVKDVTLEVGMSITAWVDGQLCGETTITDLNGQFVYKLQVQAETLLGEQNGCGATGKEIELQVDGQLIAQTHPWDNTQAHYWQLGDGFNIFLPVVLKP